MTLDPDIPLVDRVLAGEQQAFAQLVDRHKAYAYTIAIKILLNRPEAEEAAQDSFVKAYRHLADFNRQAKFSTWLYRIVFNTAITYKRKHRQSFQGLEHMALEYDQRADGALERGDKHRYLQQALQQLSESDRTAMTLFYLDELSLDEIAVVLDTPANTVKVRIHRARQRLADELKRILNQEALTL
jgi:RNA polymerase sigma factor (sigma-70 family)